MVENNADDKAPKGAKNGPDKKPPQEKKQAPEKPKKVKPSIDPAQRGPGGFDRSQLKGKAPIFRTLKKSGR